MLQEKVSRYDMCVTSPSPHQPHAMTRVIGRRSHIAEKEILHHTKISQLREGGREGAQGGDKDRTKTPYGE